MCLLFGLLEMMWKTRKTPIPRPGTTNDIIGSRIMTPAEFNICSRWISTKLERWKEREEGGWEKKTLTQYPAEFIICSRWISTKLERWKEREEGGWEKKI